MQNKRNLQKIQKKEKLNKIKFFSMKIFLKSKRHQYLMKIKALLIIKYKMVIKVKNINKIKVLILSLNKMIKNKKYRIFWFIMIK